MFAGLEVPPAVEVELVVSAFLADLRSGSYRGKFDGPLGVGKWEVGPTSRLGTSGSAHARGAAASIFRGALHDDSGTSDLGLDFPRLRSNSHVPVQRFLNAWWH